MEQRLQELKEKITSFVEDYNVKDLKVSISKGVAIPTKVNLEIRV